MVDIERLRELEAHLWGAANILRGSIDSSDFKHYIFGLLFYKRLSDVWEEEYEAVKAQYGEEVASDPSEHRFHIPKGFFWSDVRKVSANIGEYLNKAFMAIEDNNTKLSGIFNGIDFNQKERFSDAILERLLVHFDKLKLRNSEVASDILGQAYEYLIAQFADDAGKKGGEFFTPKMVVRLIVELIQPEEQNSVYDPACGSGGMLLESYKYLAEHGKNPKNVTLYGQEKNLNTWSICKMNLFLHDIEDAFIERGDTLIDPKHQINMGGSNAGTLRTFDRVVANPPFSLKEWGYELWKDGDKYNRDIYGVPPKSYGDLAFVQHMISSLNDKGKMGVILPHGVLFRGGTEGKIRQGMIEDDIIEAVVGLPTNLFYGTGIPACIMIINKDKAANRKNKILFINAHNDYLGSRNQNFLRDEDIGKIVAAFKGNEDVDGYCYFVSLEEIVKNDYNLNIIRYVDSGEKEEVIDVRAEIQQLRVLEQEYADIEAQFTVFMKQLEYEE